MPIQVSWDDEAHSIIRLDYDGSWTWVELFEALHRANALAGTIDTPVARISDLCSSDGIPPNPLPQLMPLSRLVDPRMDMHVTVGANRTVHMLADLFFRLCGPDVQRERFHWADSLEQARFMIAVYRERTQNTPAAM
jgi:hypothetical protein